MNMYEIVNTVTGEVITGAMGYTEVQRYMRTNNLSRENYEIKIYVPVRRKTIETEAPVQGEAEAKREEIKAIIADAYETSSNTSSPYIKVEFKDSRTAAIRLAQLENIGVTVETCGNPAWLKFIP